MRKKGFTLIELLAVIVILAVIALIAVPVILSLVDKSRRKAAEESAVLYVDTIENMLMLNNIENTDGKTYKVKGRTVVDENDKVILNLEIKGDVPYNGVENVIKINSGFIEEANLRFNSYYVHYEMDMTTKKFKTCTSQKGFLDKCDGTGEVKPVDPNEPEEPKGNAAIEIAKGKTYLATVYFDPTDVTKICTKEQALANLNEFGTPTNIKTGCMKWYVYKEDEENYTMLLDHNMGSIVTWNSINGPATDYLVKQYFDENAIGWEESIKNTVRLISADEIAEITGASREDTIKWNAKKRYSGKDINIDNQISRFYLDGSGTNYDVTDGWMKQVATTPGSSKYAWLYDYTNECTGATKEYGCNLTDNNTYSSAMAKNPIDGKVNGYWTSQSAMGCGYSAAWAVNYQGRLDTAPTDFQQYGIRPVITVSKALFFS